MATIDDVSVSVESGALICTEKQAVTANVANSATQATLDHAAFSVAVVAGDTLIISGHTGSAAHLAMNQEFIVKSVTSTTETVLTGSGMTAAGGGTSYSAGTIIVSKPAARKFFFHFFVSRLLLATDNKPTLFFFSIFIFI